MAFLAFFSAYPFGLFMYEWYISLYNVNRDARQAREKKLKLDSELEHNQISNAIEVQWQPNVADIRVGLALSAWGSWGRLLRTIFLLFVFPAFAFSVLLNIVGSKLNVGTVPAGMAAGLLFCGIFLIAFRSLFARMRLKVELAHGPSQTIAVSEAAVERRPETGKVIRHPWSAFSRAVELPKVFLLMNHSVLVAGIEKSGIRSEAELERLRVLIS
ncbi:MAG TPA: hypothetical protein VH105_08445, partial [Burkholderiales bacterium]|nr:hypothetical protein [Burkholderiales bacterium]